jgi:secondary thiamine-phosphate synthase enzyme
LKVETLQINSHRREELINITATIEKFVRNAGLREGVVIIFVPHTTAAVTINENADPDVKHDIIHKLNSEFPQNDSYLHGEGNSDAHIKSSLIGPSLQIIVTEGKLLLGTWQGIYFCEFDGPRSRNVYIKAIAC